MTPKTVHPVGLLVFFIAVTGLLPAALAADLPFSSSGVSGSKRVKTLKELRSEDIIQQSLDFSCGPAALATILSYYFKDPVQEKDIIRYLLISGDVKKIKQRKGFSMLDLKRYCTYRGYQVTGYRGDLEFFAKLKKPVLVPVNIKDYNHFVILRGVKGDRVFLADPALGRMTMLAARFEKIWKDGIGLVLSKPGKEDPGPLALADDEDAVKADTEGLKSSFSADQIGRVLGKGEW